MDSKGCQRHLLAEGSRMRVVPHLAGKSNRFSLWDSASSFSVQRRIFSAEKTPGCRLHCLASERRREISHYIYSS